MKQPPPAILALRRLPPPGPFRAVWLLGVLVPVLFVLLLSAALAGGFLKELPEIPLPDGFVELSERTVTFDKPSGRIVKVFARGPGPLLTVRKFYHATLPQLGWRVIEGDRFTRDDEQLRLFFTVGKKEILIEFAVTPAG